jgi:hypothetical protein
VQPGLLAELCASLVVLLPEGLKLVRSQKELLNVLCSSFSFYIAF